MYKVIFPNSKVVHCAGSRWMSKGVVCYFHLPCWIAAICGSQRWQWWIDAWKSWREITKSLLTTDYLMWQGKQGGQSEQESKLWRRPPWYSPCKAFLFSLLIVSGWWQSVRRTYVWRRTNRGGGKGEGRLRRSGSRQARHSPGQPTGS